MIVRQSGLRAGDLVCEVPCPSEEDAGKRWVIEGFAGEGDAADCRLLHPTRTERRPIPVARIHLIARDCPPATEAARDPRDIADVFAREPAAVNANPWLPPMEIVPGSLEARAVCGGFEIHFSVRAADPCGGRKEGDEQAAGRPEMDPQPVR